MIRRRAGRLVVACMLVLGSVGSAVAQAPAAAPRTAVAPPARTGKAPPAGPVRNGGTIESIKVDGNQRIETATVLSYMLVRPGDPFDADRLDRSLKTLYATGLFQDVRLARDGDTLVVHVVENPLVNRVAFEGNHKLTDDQLRQIIQVKPRAVFTPAVAEEDRQRILDGYAKRGYYNATVSPQVIRLDQNRVDVVFQINDGEVTLISKIVFVGNKEFSEGRLSEVINSRESRWWRFLSTSDEYDPDRLSFDKELLRRFYLKNGYIDFTIVDAKSELAPDRSGFFLTFTIREGDRYRVGKVDITSHLRNLTGDSLRSDLQLESGDWYDGDAVGRSVEAMEKDVHDRGYSFVEVKPLISKHPDKKTVDLAFDVGEGPRVYVERIDIVGNTRTKDKVIRREFRLAEGDAYNSEQVRLSRQRLQDLNYFNSVNMSQSPGSSPDKTIVTSTVDEKATGELTLGGGYSTDAGALVDIGLSERNLVGTGISAGINGVLAQRRSSITASVTDPYFLDRNLVVGGDVFLVQTNNLGTEPYDEKRVGFDVRAGYDFNEYLRQVWSYTLVGRTVFNVQPNASFFISQEAGYTLLSQVSQAITLDHRDSKIDPHSGYQLTWGTDVAGLGGNSQFVRNNVTGQYFIPLDRFTGNSDWGIAVTGSIGYLWNEGVQEQIIDRFYLGGDNLRGFQVGGAGPHDAVTGDPLGGRFIWTQSTELRFPLPVSPDLGLSGRAFVDVGGLTQASFQSNTVCIEPGGQPCQIVASAAPRVGAGVGISWRTQFGLLNVDLAPFVIKQPFDQTQIFRFGFGTRF
ncbi:MAG TPA: outer membrane protein assembly factor BamA [Acetobacteraceae bacterium]|nr:outer membrane protein assembly factor BamA [Acetobacteraceae bacterium]